MDKVLQAFEQLKWQKLTGYVKRGHYILNAEQLRPSYILLTAISLMFLFLMPLSITQQSHALSKTWDGGCGATITWSCANNWSDNIVPAAGDTVTFNATSTNNSTVDSLFSATETIVTININSGYTGTITLATTLHVTTSFVQGAGTFTAANQTLDLNGSFTLSAGTFTASSGSTTLAGAMTVSGSPTFSANGGTFTFDGAVSATLSCNSVTFNLVTFLNTSGTKTVNSDCNLPLGVGPTITGRVTLRGTLSGSATLTVNNDFIINTGAVLSGFNGFSETTGTFTISGATVSFGSYTTVNFDGAFVLSSGAVFTAPSGIATFAAAFTLNSGTTFNANGGIVTFDVGGATLSCNNASFNLVIFAHTSGTKTINSDCSLPLGSNPTLGVTTNSDISLSGTLSGSGTLTIGAANTNNDLTLNSGYALSGFSGLVVNGTFTATGATANFGSYTTFDANSTFTLSSGAVFTAPAGTMTVAGAFTINSGTTFSANAGVVAFDSGSATLSCNNTVFNLVHILNTGNTAKTVGADCSLPLGNNPTIGISSDNATDLILNGTLMGSGTLRIASAGASNNFTLNSTAALSGFTGLTAGILTVSGATLNFSTYTTTFTNVGYAQTGGTVTAPSGADYNGVFTLNSPAIFIASSGTITIAGSFTLNSGTTFNANNGTVTFDGGVGLITCNNVVFNLVVFAHTTSTKTVSSDCSLPLGATPTMSKSVTLNGTLSGSGTLTAGNAFTLNAGAVLSGFSGLDVEGGFFNSGATTDLGNYGLVDFNGSFALSLGTFTAPSGIATFASDFTISGGAFDANDGTVILDGGSQNLDGTVSFYNLTRQAGGTFNINDGSSVTINGALVLNDSLNLGGSLSGSGSLDLPSGTLLRLNLLSSLSGFTGLAVDDVLVDGATVDFSTYNTSDIDGNLMLQNTANFTATSANMTIGGDFDVESGSSFDPNGGSVILDGNDQTISGLVTFNNLNKTVATAATLTLPNGVNETIQGSLTLKGAPAQLLSLVSSSPGTQWQINAQGSRTLQYLDISDSLNLSGTTMVACNSVDGGGNTDWSFNPASCTPTSGGGSSSGGSSSDNSSTGAGTSVSAAGDNTGNEKTTTPESSRSATTPEVTKPSENENTLPGGSTTSGALQHSKTSWLLVGFGLPLASFFVWWFVFRRHKHADNTLPPTILYPQN